MKTIIALILTLLFAACSDRSDFASETSDADTQGPLSIVAIEGARVEYMPEAGIHFYSLCWDENSVFMISKWPAPTPVSAIHGTVISIAKDALKSIKNDHPEMLDDEAAVTEMKLEGESISGTLAYFFINGETDEEWVQMVFMVSIEGNIWNGQFTGPFPKLDKVIEVIEKIKPGAS